MKTLLGGIVAFAFSLNTHATIIPVNVGSPRVVTGDIFLSLTALNGTPVNGQTLSLDYQFSSLVHLFPATYSGFYFAFRAQTNMTPQPNAVYPAVSGSSYAVGLNNYQGPGQTFGDSGIIIIGPNVTEILFGFSYPTTPFVPGLHDPFYLTGLHFDLTLPEIEGVEITGLQLHIDPVVRGWRSKWAIVESVPETGSTALLFALSLAALVVLRVRRMCGS